MAPVPREGRVDRDALRGALAGLMKVETKGVVPRSRIGQVAVTCTRRARLSDSVTVSVPSTTSSSSTFPTRTFARSIPVPSRTGSTSAIDFCQFVSVPRRWAGPRGDTLPPTTSSAWSVPRRSPCSTLGVEIPVLESSQRRGLLCSSRLPGSSSTPGPSSSGLRCMTSSSSVRSSLNNFPLEEADNAVSNVSDNDSSMPVEAVNIALSSIADSTLAKYKLMFKRFQIFANAKGVNVLEYRFSKILFIGFLLSIYKSKGSIGSLLMARASIKFFWVLNSSSEPSPTDSEFVSKFFKGLSKEKRLFNPVQKAYPLNYTELQQLFAGVCGNKVFSTLPFAKQRFIAILIMSFSSCTRFEEIKPLLVGQVNLVGADFSINFKKGKRYLESRYGVIPDMCHLDFNPAAIFMEYREIVASLHVSCNSDVDFLFPNSTTRNNVTVIKNESVKYDSFLKTLKKEASNAHLSFLELERRLGAHSLRRGPVTAAINAGTSDLHVQKLMRVDSLGNVSYYSEADHNLLLAASKSAF